MLLVFNCCETNYHKLSSLKTIPLDYLTVSRGQGPGSAQPGPLFGVLWGWNPDISSPAFSPGAQGAPPSSRGCWQNIGPCGCRTEVPVFLPAVRLTAWGWSHFLGAAHRPLPHSLLPNLLRGGSGEMDKGDLIQNGVRSPERGAFPHLPLIAACLTGRKKEDNNFDKGGHFSPKNFISCF